MNSREEILKRVRRAARGVPDRPAHGKAAPATAWEERVARFVARARLASATVARVRSPEGVAVAIVQYLGELHLPLVVHAGGGLLPGDLHGLSRDDGPLRTDGHTLVSGCYAAVAEEGVVVMASSADHAPESAFLAATHIVVVRSEQMLDSLESLWAHLREGAAKPRMLNMILGPSRTADLGLPSRLGAHGPLRVHVILVEPAPAGTLAGP